MINSNQNIMCSDFESGLGKNMFNVYNNSLHSSTMVPMDVYNVLKILK